MDIFGEVTKITDDLDIIVEVVCPELRPTVYYMAQVFDKDWRYSHIYARKFLDTLSKHNTRELIYNLDMLGRHLLFDKTSSIEEIVKSVLEYSDASAFNKPFFKKIITTPSREGEDEINSIGNSILNICNRITESELYPDFSSALRGKSAAHLLGFSIWAISKIVECKLEESGLSESDIVNLCFLFLAAFMRYNLNNMQTEVWLPAITGLMAENGGRYFRLCKIRTPYNEDSVSLFNTLFAKTDLKRAVNPDWHHQLYQNIKTSEFQSSYKGLHKLFLFHMIDQIVTVCATSSVQKRNIEDLFSTLRPYPDNKTLQRYFNLYIGTPIYNENINCSSWKPDKLLYNLLNSYYPEYNECLEAMRNEYFPEYMFDLNSMVSAACEFYDDKFHLDLSRKKITDINIFDNVSVWLTAEWIINNRNYPFIEGMTINALADLIGSAVTGHKP